MSLTTLKFRLFMAVGLGYIYLAVVFVIVGLTTNYWLEIRSSHAYNDDVEMHFGLKRVCWVKSDRCNNPSGSYDKKNFLPKVQALVITGGVLGLIASILALANFYRELLELNLKISSIATVVVALLSGLILMIACILFSEQVEIDKGYGTMFERYVYKGYSFGLTTCAGGMMWIGAILVSMANFCGKFDEAKPPPYPPQLGTPSSFRGRSPAPSYIS